MCVSTVLNSSRTSDLGHYTEVSDVKLHNLEMENIVLFSHTPKKKNQTSDMDGNGFIGLLK